MSKQQLKFSNDWSGRANDVDAIRAILDDAGYTISNQDAHDAWSYISRARSSGWIIVGSCDPNYVTSMILWACEAGRE